MSNSTDPYFLGGDGKEIRKGDRCKWDGDPDTVWVIASTPAGMSVHDGVHPNSNYMTVWAKPESCTSSTWTNQWVRRKTKGFSKL